MELLKKSVKFIRNCVELYIPVISLAALFIVFCFQVFMRYIARNPQSWTMEVEQSCFLWLVLLGACYAQRERSHVTFTLLYDFLGAKGKALTTLLGNLLIVITFTASAIPSLNYILGQAARAQVTSILKISKTIVFFPYFIFLLFIILYSAADIFEEIMVLRGDPVYTKRMLSKSVSDVDLAIHAVQAAPQPDTDSPAKKEGN